jgi:hypothetical protein
MSVDKKALSKLSPTERLKKLRLLEEEQKKNSAEIEKLIKESEKDLKADELAEKVRPQQREVDISNLFEVPKEDSGNLEHTARMEGRGDGAAEITGYQALMQTYKDYSKLKEFYGVIQEGDNLSREQVKTLGKIGERILFAEKYMSDGEKIDNLLSPSKSILYKLKKETGLN